MQMTHETPLESRPHSGTETSLSLVVDIFVAQGAAVSAPMPGLLDSLQQAQAAFSDSLERYIEL